VKKSLSSDHS